MKERGPQAGPFSLSIVFGGSRVRLARVRLGQAFLVTWMAATSSAQDVAPTPAAPASAQAPAGRAAEVPVEGFVRQDQRTIALTLPAATGKLEVGNFEFEGSTVPTDKIHLRQLSPGVF